MKISSTHVHTVLAWDITVLVEAEGSETIADVRVNVNGFDMDREAVDPDCTTWKRTYLQKGDFPGSTRLKVSVSDATGKQRTYQETWDA